MLKWIFVPFVLIVPILGNCENVLTEFEEYCGWKEFWWCRDCGQRNSRETIYCTQCRKDMRDAMEFSSEFVQKRLVELREIKDASDAENASHEITWYDSRFPKLEYAVKFIVRDKQDE